MMGMVMRDTVTVSRAPFSGGYRKEHDWSAAQSHEEHGCSLQPGTTGADTDERRAYTEGATLFLRFGADIEPGDKVTHDGISYEVVGVPMRMRSPSGRISHVRCELRRWS